MYEKVHSMKMILDKDTFKRFDLSGKQMIELEVSGNPSIYLCLTDEVDVEMNIVVKKDASCKVLCFNESISSQMKSVIRVEENAELEITYGEMSDGEVSLTQEVHLDGTNARCVFKSASVVKNKKHFTVDCIHHAPHTEGLMENYAVVYENGDYKMVDTGKIVSGAYQSESHQTSRALILDENQSCDITPLLLIDENDVQASHATSMGQIDENQLYYLQTRGLTKQQALGLITIGYLMPVASALDHEELQSELSAKIEKKVGLS